MAAITKWQEGRNSAVNECVTPDNVHSLTSQLSQDTGEVSVPVSSSLTTTARSTNASGLSLGYTANHIPSLPVIEVLLALIYLTILCDIVYALAVRYTKPKLYQPRTTSAKPSWPKQPFQNPQSTNKKKGILTLDNLWKRLLAESQHLQMLDSQHRAITENMMEARLQARILEREKSLRRASSVKWTDTDYSTDMVQWATRIYSDHHPRTK